MISKNDFLQNNLSKQQNMICRGRLPYVYCCVYDYSNKIALVQEPKSGLFGMPKEKIWTDETDITPQKKAQKILKDLNILVEETDIKQHTHNPSRNQTYHITSIELSQKTAENAPNLVWFERNKDMSDREMFNSSTHFVNKF